MCADWERSSVRSQPQRPTASWAASAEGGSGQGGDCPPLLCPREPHLQCCVQAWGPAQEGWELLEWARGGNEDAQRLEHLCYGDRLRSRGVQHGEEKGPGNPHRDLPVLEGRL